MDKRGSELVRLVHPGSYLYETSPVRLHNGFYNGYITLVCYCTSQILGAHMQASRCILWQLTFDLRGISSCDPRVAIFQSLNQPWAGHVEVMPRFGGQNLGQTESSREQPHLQICRKGYTVIPV